MSAANQRQRSQEAAAALLAKGIYHGKRQSKPYPNSGGLTMVNAPGSSKFQRIRKK